MSHFHECPSCHCSYVCHADCTVEGNGYGARSECGPCGPPRVTDYVRGRADALRDAVAAVRAVTHEGSGVAKSFNGGVIAARAVLEKMR